MRCAQIHQQNSPWLEWMHSQALLAKMKKKKTQWKCVRIHVCVCSEMQQENANSSTNTIRTMLTRIAKAIKQHSTRTTTIAKCNQNNSDCDTRTIAMMTFFSVAVCFICFLLSIFLLLTCLSSHQIFVWFIWICWKD